ncbi:MAG: PadR family transcriptional regulator [Thermoplasmata archaeon]
MNWHLHKRRGLRPWIVYLLQESPRNGAEIIEEMERRSHGWWRPSPGSVYPLLEELERTGTVQKGADGRYSVVASARYECDFPFGFGARSVDDTVREISGLVSYLEDLRPQRTEEIARSGASLRALIGRIERLAS